MLKKVKFWPLVILLSLSGCSVPSNSSSQTLLSTTSSFDIPLSSSKAESKWGSAYTSMIIDKLGVDVPYLEAPSFDIEESKDDFGDPLICFYLYFDEESISSKLSAYSEQISDEGYSVDFETIQSTGSDGSVIVYDCYFAEKVISTSSALELQFLEGSHNGKEAMGIFAFNSPYDNKNKWPSNLVISLLGEDIPHLDGGDGWTYEAKIHAEGYIDMVISGVPTTSEDDYVSLLKKESYSVSEPQYDSEDESYLGRFAYPPSKKFCIQFGLTTYGLEIFIYKL
jgi:hypothetical protein